MPLPADERIAIDVAIRSIPISPHGAPSDAFYTFKGFLGARRKLPGRDGPPGADFNTLPALKPLASQLLMGFWREGDRDDLTRLEASYGKTGNPLDFVRAQAVPFLQTIATPP